MLEGGASTLLASPGTHQIRQHHTTSDEPPKPLEPFARR